MKSFYCIEVILLVSYIISIACAANCYGPTTQILVDEFSAFPSPVNVGETVYIRAKVTPKNVISSAVVQIRVYYTTQTDVDLLVPDIYMHSLDFCTISTRFSCPLSTASTILSWEFVVPDIPSGTYQVRYNIIDMSKEENATSCIQFEIHVGGSKAQTNFKSWYKTNILGTAVFTNSPNIDYTQRSIGDNIQVGPEGPLSDPFGIHYGIANGPPYGSLNGLVGSGDLVPGPAHNTSVYLWGLTGVMTKKALGPKTNQQSHIYEGTCYLGYVNGLVRYDHTNPLLTGNFYLTWNYTDGNTAQVSGYAEFQPSAIVPPGWGYPMLFGKLGRHQIVTDESGFLTIQASSTYCTTGTNCNPGSSSSSSSGGKSGLESDELGMAIGIPIAAVFIAVLVAAALLYAKQRRETEQEDGIFAVARKPEYGSALVVDDIIEETRGNKNLRSMLDAEYDESDEDDDDDEDDSERSRSRSPSARSASLSRSRSRSVRRSGDESDQDSRSESEYSD